MNHRVLPASYVFTVSPGAAIAARTIVRWKIGWRKGIAISQRGSAGPAFLRDKSRAPCQFLARTVNTYAGILPAEEPEKGPADGTSGVQRSTASQIAAAPRVLFVSNALDWRQLLECAGRAQRRRRFGFPARGGVEAGFRRGACAKSKAAWRFASRRRTPKCARPSTRAGTIPQFG
jgi:hypothetical protein